MAASAERRAERAFKRLKLFSSMKKLFFVLLSLCWIIESQAQIDARNFENQLDSLFRFAKQEFKPIIGLKSYDSDNLTFYHSVYTPTGGHDSKISIDDENSRSYYVYFELSTPDLTEKELTKIAQHTENVGLKYGLTRKNGTDIKYQKFNAIRIEFDSDNIDILGKHPSFTIGILKNSNTIEMVINEPLWK